MILDQIDQILTNKIINIILIINNGVSQYVQSLTKAVLAQ